MAIGESAGLLFKIKADSSQASAEVKKFQKDLKGIEAASKDSLSPLQNMAASAGLSAEQFTKLGGTLSIVTGVVGAVASAALAGGAALFKLAESASEFGSQIFDASQKTGLSAETLSALKVAADQSGSSLEQITSATAKFAKTVGDAADGSDKATAILKKFGLEPQAAINDLDAALEKVFQTIVDAKPGVEQLALAQAAFGKSGSDLIPVIKSFDGDMKKLIATAKELGLTLTDEDARAADEFGDQLDTLRSQLAAVGRTLGFEVIPVFNEFFGDLSNWLSKNKGEVKGWAEGIVYYVRKLIVDVKSELNDLEGIKQVLTGFFSAETSEQIGQRLQNVRTEAQRLQILKQQGYQNRSWDNTSPGNVETDDYAAFRSGKLPAGSSSKFGGIDDADAKKEAEKRAKERQEIAKRDAAAQIQILQNQLKASLEAYDAYNKQLEGKIKEGQFVGAGAAGTARGQLLNAELNDLIPALEAAENAQAQSLKKTANEIVLIKQEQNDRIDDINKKQADAQTRLNEAITDAEKKASKDSVDTAKKSAEDKLAIRRADTDRQLAQFELELQRKYLSEVNYIRAVGLARLSLLEIERNNETDKTKQAVLDAKIAEQKLKNIKDIEAAETAAHEKRRERWNEYVQNLIRIQELEDKEAERRAAEERQRTLETTVGSGFEISAIQQLNDYFAGEGNTAALAGIEAITQAFEGLANAVGAAVQAYVLYGSAGSSVRQVTAQILAAIAQQAAIKAIFELAEGFAALAMSFFGIPNAGPSAAAHFAAAAIYGSIAAVAAVAGRAVAGDSFKKQASGGGSGGVSSSGDRDNSPLSRQSGNAFESRREGTVFQRAADAMDRAALAMVESSQSVKETMGPLRPMSPGDVLAAGAEENRGFLASTVAREIESNAGYGTRLRRAQGI